MNTQLSPEEIQRYKQDMMNMYQGTGKTVNTANAQKTTAVSAPAAPAQIQAQTQATAPPKLYQNTVTAGSGTRFHLPDQSFIESLKSPNPEPEYTGANVRRATPVTPDVGAIAAPEASADVNIAPRPPAGGTYYPDTGAIGVPNYPGIVSTGPAAAPSVPSPAPTPTPPKPPISPGFQTPDTGYIEAPASSEETMGTGYLRVQVHTANRAIPVPDAMLIVTEETPLGRKLVRMSITDENGYSDLIPLEVPVYPLDEFPNPENKPYRDYRLSAFADGYYIVPRIEVPIFSDVKSLQSVEMVPLAENTSPLSLFPSTTSGSNTEITSVEFEQN
jgi:hypothetical protein